MSPVDGGDVTLPQLSLRLDHLLLRQVQRALREVATHGRAADPNDATGRGDLAVEAGEDGRQVGRFDLLRVLGKVVHRMSPVSGQDCPDRH